MKPVLTRFIAILLLVIPGISATYGFLKMKNVLFAYFAELGQKNPSFDFLHFALGFLFFIFGVGFIGGWIFFRDRKRNYVAPRFRAKRPRPPRPTNHTNT